MNEEYQAALKATQELHAGRKVFSGRFMLRYLPDILRLRDQYGCKTMLDYGCGKGKQYGLLYNGVPVPEVLGMKVTMFDPGVVAYSNQPEGKFDMVICTQVIGNIPVSSMPWFVDELHRYAKTVLYVGERLGPVGKRLHEFMEDKMPRGYDHNKWAEQLARPDGLPVWLRTMGGIDGTPGGGLTQVQ